MSTVALYHKPHPCGAFAPLVRRRLRWRWVPHVAPAKHFKATMLYYPGTEELQRDEVRVIFMGSTYYPNQSQSGMSIFVELGYGDNFVFDLGIGSLRNYNSFSIPFNTINHVFFTHLHMDHMSDLPSFMMFRPRF